MVNENKIEEMKIIVAHIQQMLDRPEPGLWTWDDLLKRYIAALDQYAKGE